MTSTSGWSPSRGRKGSMNARMTRTEPTRTRAPPRSPTSSPRRGYGRNWRVTTSMRIWVAPPGWRSRLAWRMTWAPATARRRSPTKTRRSQRLIPIPGVSQRRRFIAASLPVELAVEDGNRPEVPFAEPRGEVLGEDDRAVVAAGAADRDRQSGLALFDVGRQGVLEELVDRRQEAPGEGLVQDVGPNGLGQARQVAELVDVERVLQEADVVDEVRLERHAVFEAEADELNREGVRRGQVAEVGEQPLPKLPQGQVRRVEDDVGLRPQGLQDSSLLGDGTRDPALVGQRMAMARLREAPDQDLIAGLQEEHLWPDPAALEGTAHRCEGQHCVPCPNVEDDGNAGEPVAVDRHELGQARQQLTGQIIDNGVAEVLEELRRGGLPPARQPAE